ncbi:MAG: (2Fe-2S) ferredoxin domain-containing protein, partial [Firmicutes bacterium]|nr:(2Fe-2S) ferredoxin domain-containing protein [Bacillota bacterium]
MNRLDEFIQLQEQIRAQYKAKTDDTVYVGMGTCGLAAGSGDVHRFLQSYLKERAPNLKLVPVGCIGLDEQEVLVDVQLAGKERYSYGRMDIDRTREVINRHG